MPPPQYVVGLMHVHTHASPSFLFVFFLPPSLFSLPYVYHYSVSDKTVKFLSRVYNVGGVESSPLETCLVEK